MAKEINDIMANVFGELHYQGSYANLDDNFQHNGKNYHLMGRNIGSLPWVKTTVQVCDNEKKPSVRQSFKSEFRSQVRRITEAGKGTFYTVGPNEVYFKWTVVEEKK